MQTRQACLHFTISPDKLWKIRNRKKSKSRNLKNVIDRKTKIVRRTNIGGQAVLEGVMMKGARSIATAVRTPDGDITVESKYTNDAKQRNAFCVCRLSAAS